MADSSLFFPVRLAVLLCPYHILPKVNNLVTIRPVFVASLFFFFRQTTCSFNSIARFLCVEKNVRLLQNFCFSSYCEFSFTRLTLMNTDMLFHYICSCFMGCVVASPIQVRTLLHFLHASVASSFSFCLVEVIHFRFRLFGVDFLQLATTDGPMHCICQPHTFLILGESLSVNMIISAGI